MFTRDEKRVQMTTERAAAGPPRRRVLGRAADVVPREWRSASRLAPLGLSLLSTALILGPALGRGVVLSYDLVWSPDRRLTPFATGSGTPAPRAVPSDAFAWLLGWLVSPSVAQKVILAAILLLASAGVVALLRHLRPQSGTAATSVAAIAALWNPFVSERLVVGQWTVLLGYAVVPWMVRAAMRSVSGAGSAWAGVLIMCMAGLGGVNTVLMAALTASAVLLVGAVRYPRRSLESLALLSLVTAGVSAVWVLPSLDTGVSVDRDSVAAFAPVSDTPLGVWGSLLSGGGFWNTASHPGQRAVLLIAVVAAMLSVLAVIAFAHASHRAGEWPLVVPAVVGAGVVALSVMPASRGLWIWMVTEVPGGGALRDSHKFLASWVVIAAVGLGVVADHVRHLPPRVAGLAAALAGLIVLLSPQLAWGIGGRLDAEAVPVGYRDGAAQLSAEPQGEVGLLPWSQYRRYDWNGDRVSLTLAPRIIDQRLLFDDSLPLRAGAVEGENPRAAAVTAEIEGGTSPLAALRAAGVRYVAAELGAGLDVDQDAVRAAGRVVVDDPHLLIVDLGDDKAGMQSARLGGLGWALTLLTFVVFVTGAAVPWRRRKLPAGLLRSRP